MSEEINTSSAMGGVRNEFYRVSIRTDHPDETDEIRGWSHEIRGPIINPHGVLCWCLTKDIADRFCEWLNTAPAEVSDNRQVSDIADETKATRTYLKEMIGD